MDDLERIELSAVLDLFSAAPPDVARAFDLAVLDLGDGAAFSIGAHPKMLLFNRVLGVEDDMALPEIERWFAARGCAFAVSVRRGAERESALVERGYRPASACMKFRRGAEQPPVHQTSLRIEQISEERASDYGSVVAAVFGLESPLDRWFAVLCTPRLGVFRRLRRQSPRRHWRGAHRRPARMARSGRDSSGGTWPWRPVGATRSKDRCSAEGRRACALRRDRRPRGR